MQKPDLVGMIEIADMLGIQHGSVRAMRLRGTLPQELMVVSSRPLWWREDILQWALETGRIRA